MSLFDVGADLQSALEVKPNLAPGQPGGASPPGGARAKDAPRADGNRDALTVAQEALSRVNEMSSHIQGLSRANQEVLSAVLGRNGAQTAPTAEPSKRPFGQDQLAKFLEQGMNQELFDALEANRQFERKQDRSEITQEFENRVRNEKLGEFLMTELDLVDAGSKRAQLIRERSDTIGRQFPHLDDLSRLVVAAIGIDRRALSGEIDLPDLREDLVKNRDSTTTTPPAAQQTLAANVDWEAPNRGLPPNIVQQFHKFRLERALTKSADPQEESRFQQSVMNILNHHQTKNRQAKFKQYVEERI